MKRDIILGIFSIFLILFIAYLFSNNKRKISYQHAFNALLLQFVFAVFILKTSVGQLIFHNLSLVFLKVYNFANHGLSFVFGSLADASSAVGYIFAVKVVGAIVFFGALMSILHHVGVIRGFVKMIAFVLKPLLKTSGAEMLCAAGNSMLGPTEAPLLIKNYLKGMTESEIFLVMVSGMSTLTASLIAVYGALGVPIVHLLAASAMSIPGSILISKILVPETGIPETLSSLGNGGKRETTNILDAISVGTSDGLKLALNVGAMLISFVSLIAMADFVLVKLSTFFFAAPYTLDMVFSKIFYGVVSLLGVPAPDRAGAATLLGQKLVLNEFIAYANFVKESFLPRTRIIMTYALCGLSNFSVIGILLGGVGALCPSQRSVLTKFGLRALLGGTLVNLLNAVIAALLI